MAIPRDERHYRRGLILGLTLSEIMLLLLFLLLLLLAYLMSKEEEKTSSAIRKFELVQSTAKQLEQEILVLIEEKERFEQEIVELESGQAQSEVMLREASRAKEKLDQIIDPSNTGEVQKHWKELVLETEQTIANLESEKSLLEEKLGAIGEGSDLQGQLTESIEQRNLLETQMADLQEEIGNLSNQKDELIENIEENAERYESLLEDAKDEARDALLEGMYESRKELISHIVKDLDDAGFSEATVDFDDGVLRMPEDILFDSGNAELSDKGRKAVRALADAMTDWVPCFSTGNADSSCEDKGIKSSQAKLSAIFLEGHTDSTPVQKPETKEKYGDNWGLSSQRAINTYKEIERYQPGLKGFKNVNGQQLLSVSAYGPKRPVSVSNLKSQMAKNRRIDIRFLFMPSDESNQRGQGGWSGVHQSVSSQND